MLHVVVGRARPARAHGAARRCGDALNAQDDAPLQGLNARGLPTGVQVVGNVGAERLLIKVAEDLEEAYSGWANPTCDVC